MDSTDQHGEWEDSDAPSGRVWLGNISAFATVKSVRDTFAPYGPLTDAAVFPAKVGPSGYAVNTLHPPSPVHDSSHCCQPLHVLLSCFHYVTEIPRNLSSGFAANTSSRSKASRAIIEALNCACAVREFREGRGRAAGFRGQEQSGGAHADGRPAAQDALQAGQGARPCRDDPQFSFKCINSAPPG